MVPSLQTMGVSLRSSASVASSGASHVPPIRDPTIEAHQVERAERDDDEDPLGVGMAIIHGQVTLQLRHLHRILFSACTAVSFEQSTVDWTTLPPYPHPEHGVHLLDSRENPAWSMLSHDQALESSEKFYPRSEYVEGLPEVVALVFENNDPCNLLLNPFQTPLSQI
ncbi:hypothetical protein Taro_052564 [Colocasia esculenta]|uniref:Uncharacterized protein n=1 Tax=Colocasia esculenta TaxID=4460 RepID=A0A843XKL9_COLES|nr:hypothetical protein [Colocasia esculenta]